jgi:hypothetical protein
MAHDNAQWRTKVLVEERAADIEEYRRRYGKEEGERRFFALPARVVAEDEGNLLTTAGADALLTALVAGLTPLFNNANAFLGVGDSTTAEAAGQADLQAATNKVRVGMDATYPTHAAGTNSAAFRATFGTGQANYAWQEYGIFNAATGGTMLQRKVTSFGTKTAAGSWTFTVTFSLA